MGLFGASDMNTYMEQHAIWPRLQEGDLLEQQYFQLYGDSMYGVSPFMLSPYSEVGEQTAEECQWNAQMGGIRISVEHGFGLVLQDWPYLCTTWKHQILGNSCSLFYRVGVLLTNAHTCVSPNQTMLHYGCMPPFLDKYFHAPSSSYALNKNITFAFHSFSE
jgi:hypothetical protein